MNNYNSLLEIIQANRRISHHFFDASSMRFFASIAHEETYRGVYFITSEKFEGNGHYEDGERLFTVRMCIDGRIETAGDFQQHETEQSAIDFINSLPEQFPQAYEFAREEFNGKGGERGEFAEHAGNKDKNSFCEACAYIIDNYEALDLNYIKHLLPVIA